MAKSFRIATSGMSMFITGLRVPIKLGSDHIEQIQPKLVSVPIPHFSGADSEIHLPSLLARVASQPP
jgi:hypothetical protein